MATFPDVRAPTAAVNGDLPREQLIRSPPRGLSADEFSLCSRADGCRLGAMCLQAHSQAELTMWIQGARLLSELDVLDNRSLAERINIQLQSNIQHDEILKKHIDGIEMYIDRKASLVIDNKSEVISWIFSISTKECVSAITMLDSQTSANFSVQSVVRNISGSNTIERLPVAWGGEREWLYPNTDDSELIPQSFKVKVQFKCDSYGVYKQRVVFSFGRSVYLYRELKVTVRQMVITNQAADLAITESQRWESIPGVQIMRCQLFADEEDEVLQRTYKRPTDIRQCVAIVEADQRLSVINYKRFLHSLLYIEETEQFHELSKMKLNGLVNFSKTYTTESLANSTTNYARPNELFGKLPLDGSLSEDTVQGRILLQNVNSLLITCGTDARPDKVFECRILEQSKDGMVFRATSDFVNFSEIQPETSKACQVQFVVNRLPFCEIHSALDQLDGENRLFPSSQDITHLMMVRLWAPQIVEPLHGAVNRLNAKQREGFREMAGPPQHVPVLLIGPFGTGKTMTLAATIFHLLADRRSRILVCTHSNSAADLYIKDHIHPYLTNSAQRPKVLRIYYKHRWSAAVHPIIKNYTLFDQVTQSFRDPTIADLQDVKVVVITLASCYSLLRLQMPRGFFSHIMVDEAAQAKEVETLIPFVMSGRGTTMIMAGDHMQINPAVFSKYAKKYRLHESMFERLTHLYPDNFGCKVTLSANYRSHKALVTYSSDIFYKGLLEAKGGQPSHPQMHPLSFIAARGESLQHRNGTGYYNLAEVYETVDFVTDLVDNWPTQLWGELDADSIGIILPYMDQVTVLRNLLKEKSAPLRDISVEKVSNVQGKQFRVVIINTVRTYHSCIGIDETEADFGFLSNPKLLNTAITRAQSLVTIIGDPFSLVTVGKCRSLWIHFLEQCQNNGSLHGVTFAQLQDYLDYIDIEKKYKLNPKAREFVPGLGTRVRPVFTPHQPNVPFYRNLAAPMVPTAMFSQPRVAPSPYSFAVPANVLPNVNASRLLMQHSFSLNNNNNMAAGFSAQGATARPQAPLLAPLESPDYLTDVGTSWRKHTT